VTIKGITENHRKQAKYQRIQSERPATKKGDYCCAGKRAIIKSCSERRERPLGTPKVAQILSLAPVSKIDRCKAQQKSPE